MLNIKITLRIDSQLAVLSELLNARSWGRGRGEEAEIMCLTIFKTSYVT